MDQIKKALWVLLGVLLLAVAVFGGTRMNRGKYNNEMMGEVSDLSAPMMSFDGQEPALGGRSSKSLESVDVAPENSVEIDKKIIRTGSLDLKVGNADDASGKISQIAADNGGEVFSSNFYQSGKNVKSGTIEVKVPVDKFEKTFTEIKKIASLVVRESTSGQDVTMEYADLAIRLRNKQAEEQSFLQILNRSGKIEDVLAATREVARVRGEIESLQGQIKYMESQTDKSTIVVSLTEDTSITFTDTWRPWQFVKETFNGLFKDLQGVVNFLIVLVIRIIPVVILYILILLGLYWAGRKIYLKIKG